MEPGISLTPNLTAALLNWYETNGRALPWRNPPGSSCNNPVEPYTVLVSEIMLQQTTVPAVAPYFERWMLRYPTIEALAYAGIDDVLRSWEGLGYYSRARNLHAAAGEIVSDYGGRIPADPAQLKKLPGIGEYTAAAIASIAYGVRAPALDANNLRVWSRLLTTSDRRRITRTFSRIIPENRPGDFNQALMDLGSTVCTPRNPECPVCPFIPWCRAYRTDRVSEFPEKKTSPDTTRIEAAIGIIIRDGRVLVQKRSEGGLLAGLWEFPGGKVKEHVNACVGECVREGKEHVNECLSECVSAKEPKEQPVSQSQEFLAPTLHTLTQSRAPLARTLHAHKHVRESPEETCVREISEETGLLVQICEKLGAFTHSYTRFRVKLHVFICRQKAGRLHNPSAKWVTLEELEGLAMPSVNRRIVKKLEERLEAGCDD